MIFPKLHRHLTLLLATLWASVCLALPAPHDIEQQATAKVAQAATLAPAAVATPAAPAAPAPAAWLLPAALTGAFALLALWLWRRVQARPALQPQAAGMGSYSPEVPRGFGAQYDPRGPAATAYGAPYPTPAPSGSGMAGAVVGGLAGVAAGYALSKALESHDHPASASSMGSARPADPMDNAGLVRMDPPAPASDLGNFDTGSGDDWGDTPSDDSW